MGPGHHDNGGLWRYGPQDLPGHVRRNPLCPRWCTHRRPPRSRHRLQLRHVLLAHAGPRQAAQETPAGC